MRNELNKPSKAYYKGESAGKRGKPRTSNPFSVNMTDPKRSVPFEEWNKGWLAGRDFFLNGKGYKR